ncbi:YbaN family protein [Nisaea sp.]|uniref:YbaN family protein n=1 Tax=Nisaea sp. TaxID=2024842 RepID=UPI003B51A04A
MSTEPKTICGPFRYVLLAVGVVCTAIGIAGIILPGLPGTLFLLIALWAFSRSSERFHLWLYNHPRFGQGLREWHEYGVIPPRAKIAAVTMIAVTLGLLWGVVLEDWRLAAATSAVLTLVAIWIVTRPGTVKLEDPA